MILNILTFVVLPILFRSQLLSEYPNNVLGSDPKKLELLKTPKKASLNEKNITYDIFGSNEHNNSGEKQEESENVKVVEKPKNVNKEGGKKRKSRSEKREKHEKHEKREKSPLLQKTSADDIMMMQQSSYSPTISKVFEKEPKEKLNGAEIESVKRYVDEISTAVSKLQSSVALLKEALSSLESKKNENKENEQPGKLRDVVDIKVIDVQDETRK